MNQIVYAGKHLLTYSVARHSHATWELIYCTSGSGSIQFDDFSLPYRVDDIIVIPPLVPHCNESAEGFTNIHINMLEPSLTLKKPELMREKENRFIFDAFSGAFFYFSASRGLQTPVLNAYGNLIVCHLAALRETPSYSKIVETIEAAITSNYPDCDFELDSYLRDQPFSYDYVRKIFKKEVGVTPHKYLNDIRLQAAATYLGSRSGHNIAEIARLCGFNEPLYFSRMFKKKYGVSPSSYLRGKDNCLPDSDNMKIML